MNTVPRLTLKHVAHTFIELNHSLHDSITTLSHITFFYFDVFIWVNDDGLSSFMFMSFKLLCVCLCAGVWVLFFVSHFSCVSLKVGSCPVLHQVHFLQLLWQGCPIPIAWSSAVHFVFFYGRQSAHKCACQRWQRWICDSTWITHLIQRTHTALLNHFFRTSKMAIVTDVFTSVRNIYSGSESLTFPIRCAIHHKDTGVIFTSGFYSIKT